MQKKGGKAKKGGNRGRIKGEKRRAALSNVGG